MNPVLSDLNESKWNFITLSTVLISFFSLKGHADDFIFRYGENANIGNLFVKGYMEGTVKSFFLAIITLALCVLTIYISIKSLQWTLSVTAVLQGIIALAIIIATFFVFTSPFLITLFIAGCVVWGFYELIK
ncbi:hypothetical protein [Staphylococcus simulans]|nr:hypothetical protein [Staphylococcus simulans]AVO01104.1 hypothetical protein BI282_01275 [Staphylococcus simulans]AVO04055.1 hypothetical protein BI283_01275 [Staphylococcus simulans]AWG17651.1 hypothetical protein A9958_01280 [Staphylococcus simulans]AWI00619.1 hypothetical protein A7X73_01275 [Staphylococcus simulans]MCE5025482.1 hypothetical protein [Staphylococcus simulans]